MRKFPKSYIVLIYLVLPVFLFGQQSIKSKLESIKGLAVKEIKNPEFLECFEIMVEQPIDHFNPTSKTFSQQLILGFNNAQAPVAMFTEGYALGKIAKPGFISDCNVIGVEHRYFGKSKPDSLNWNFLTIKQAVYDLHHIRELLGKVFKGKWLTTGASKSGQTAIAYKMFFPEEADATIAYVTPIKNEINDSRITEYLNSELNTECGENVKGFQDFAFRNKEMLMKEFEKHVQDKKYTFNKIGNEKAFEYILLEYPFAFFQNCFDCKLIPDTNSSPQKIIEEIVSVVSPKFYSDGFSVKLGPSFYMFYHELGYYEYDLSSFKKWLSYDNYSNAVFAPDNSLSTFDNTYLNSINKFIDDKKTSKIIFVYGEHDPYTGAQPILKNSKCMKFVVKGGCHKSRIENLTDTEKEKVFKQLSTWLKWQIGN
jgi:hypothetical protein